MMTKPAQDSNGNWDPDDNQQSENGCKWSCAVSISRFWRTGLPRELLFLGLVGGFLSIGLVTGLSDL